MDRLSELLPVGPPISEEQQIGRTSAIDSLEARLRGHHVVKLLEPRRVGKTSVARASLARIKASGGSVADVNLAMRGSPEDAAKDLADQLAGGVARAGRRIGGFIKRLRDGEDDDVLGEQTEFGLRVVEELLSGDARTSPALVLERAASRLKEGGLTAVLLDEAHMLAAWPEPSRVALGSVLKDNNALGVVVASSERRALEQLTSAEGPLRYVGTRFELPSIAHEDWHAGLDQRFSELGVPITADALDFLLEQSRGHPYCTMLLAHESARVSTDVGETSAAAVSAALVTVRRDEAWKDLL